MLVKSRKVIAKVGEGKWDFILGTLIIGLIIFISFKVYGYENTWKFWNVPTIMPPFADMRLIPGSVATFQAGLDPTIKNPGDPYGRIFNYPRIWYLLFYTDLAQEDVIWLGIVFFALFYIGLLSFSGKLDRLGTSIMLLITFSPAAMLLYERGNVDLLMFFICAMAIVVLDYSTFAAAGIVLLGALLKIFPIFALVIFLYKEGKKFWRNVLFVVISFGIYSWITFSNIQASWNLTMRGKTISYGVNILFTRFHEEILKTLNQILPALDGNQVLEVFPYFLGLTVLVFAIMKSLVERPILSVRNRRNLIAFQMGAFIYIGTFLLGNNWDYRLTFLLFTIPQLADWMYTERGKYRFLVFLTISLIVISCWHLVLNNVFFTAEAGIIIDEIANWALFAFLAYFSFSSLPIWVKEILRNPIHNFPSAYAARDC